MSTTLRNRLSEVMRLAWQFVRKNGFTMSEAMKTAWANVRLRAKMQLGIVKFYFQKVGGSVWEAYGTLARMLIPATTGTETRKKNDTAQTYFDTERAEWRCFKRINLICR